VPEKSCADVPRFSWWNRKGGTEWLQMDFPSSVAVSKARVYWFADRPTGGGCALPRSWRLLYKDGAAWRPVEPASEYGVAPDRFNDVTFKRVNTTALRIEALLQPDWSAGVQEWQVE